MACNEHTTAVMGTMCPSWGGLRVAVGVPGPSRTLCTAARSDATREVWRPGIRPRLVARAGPLLSTPVVVSFFPPGWQSPVLPAWARWGPAVRRRLPVGPDGMTPMPGAPSNVGSPTRNGPGRGSRGPMVDLVLPYRGTWLDHRPSGAATPSATKGLRLTSAALGVPRFRGGVVQRPGWDGGPIGWCLPRADCHHGGYRSRPHGPRGSWHASYEDHRSPLGVAVWFPAPNQRLDLLRRPVCWLVVSPLRGSWQAPSDVVGGASGRGEGDRHGGLIRDVGTRPVMARGDSRFRPIPSGEAEAPGMGPRPERKLGT